MPGWAASWRVVRRLGGVRVLKEGGSVERRIQLKDKVVVIDKYYVVSI